MTNGSEPTPREWLVFRIRDGFAGLPDMKAAADLLEADAKALGEKDAEIARLLGNVTERENAIRAVGYDDGADSSAARIAELEALVWEVTFDNHGLGHITEGWTKRRECLLDGPATFKASGMLATKSTED